MIDENGAVLMPDGSSRISPVLMSSRWAALAGNVLWLCPNPRRVIGAWFSRIAAAGESALAVPTANCQFAITTATATAALLRCPTKMDPGFDAVQDALMRPPEPTSRS